MHADALQKPTYKQNLIQYLNEQFIKLACENIPKGTLIIDCLQPVPIAVTNGTVTINMERSNMKGEADNAIFVHASKSPCSNIFIVASDTDIIMYGLAALESQSIQRKSLIIEKEFNEDYIWLNKGLDNFQCYEAVQNSSVREHIGHAVLALYLLAGSDYLSNFFGITCEKMIMTFFKYVDFVSQEDDPFIVFKDELFENINHTAFLRLLCCIYLDKYNRLTSHIASSPVELFNIFRRASSNMNMELKTLLEWLSYDTMELKSQNIKITNIEEMASFTRRVCFFMNQGSKNLYNMMLPSENSVKLHCLRGTYVMKIALDKDACSTVHLNYETYGWLKLGDSIHIIWDEKFEEEEKKLNKKRQLPISKCSCKTGCNVNGPGCKNCCKACKPCSSKCGCKAQCNNPHNNDGDCIKCHTEDN